MKKQLIIILLIFTGFSVKAQYTPMAATGYQMKYLKIDSGFALPFIDTSLRRNVVRPGLMVTSILDSLPYYFNGVKWKPIYVDSSGVIGLIKNKVDSVTINGNNMFYWIAGLGYGQTINKVDSLTQSGDSVFYWKGGLKTYSFQLTAGSGTVTQVIGGYGLVSDTIVSNGTLLVDTSIIAAKNWSTAHFALISHTHSASDIISGTFGINRGGTGLSGIGAVGQVLRVASSGTALEYFSTPRSIDSIYITADSLYQVVIYSTGQKDSTQWVGSGVGGGGGVSTVTGLNTDNTDPLNPIIKISVDGTSITGLGTPASPLVSHASGGGGSADIKQVYTGTTSVTVTDSTTWLIVNPASIASVMTITMPASPTDKQKIEISFGGTITSGNGVVSTLTISPNSGQTLIQSSTPSYVQSGETISYRYNISNTSYYRIN